MKWEVSKISIPVFDLEESIKFYNFILGNDIETKINDVGCLDEYFVFGGNIELSLYKLKNQLSNVPKTLKETTKGGVFTKEHAVRVALNVGENGSNALGPQEAPSELFVKKELPF